MPPSFAPHRPRNISKSACTIIELLYVNPNGMNSAISVVQWHYTHPVILGSTVGTVGNVEQWNPSRNRTFAKKPRAKLVKIIRIGRPKRPELWKQKTRCDGIDTALRASNFETRPLRLMLFDTSSRSTSRRHHWIE